MTRLVLAKRCSAYVTFKFVFSFKILTSPLTTSFHTFITIVHIQEEDAKGLILCSLDIGKVYLSNFNFTCNDDVSPNETQEF